MTPVNLLSLKCRFCSAVREPNEFGITPVKLLELKDRPCSAVREPNEVGMTPVKLLSLKYRLTIAPFPSQATPVHEQAEARSKGWLASQVHSPGYTVSTLVLWEKSQRDCRSAFEVGSHDESPDGWVDDVNSALGGWIVGVDGSLDILGTDDPLEAWTSKWS